MKEDILEHLVDDYSERPVQLIAQIRPVESCAQFGVPHPTRRA
jgi:hypothetical protein